MEDLELVKRSEIDNWGEPESIWITKIKGCFFINITFYCDPTVYTLANQFSNKPEKFTDVVLSDAIALVRSLKEFTPIKIKYR